MAIAVQFSTRIIERKSILTSYKDIYPDEFQVAGYACRAPASMGFCVVFGIRAYNICESMNPQVEYSSIPNSMLQRLFIYCYGIAEIYTYFSAMSRKEMLGPPPCK